MLPVDLTASSFATYPPEARAFAVAHLGVLRRLPLVFLPSLLREVVEYDFKFPAERARINLQMTWLRSMSDPEFAASLSGFTEIRLSPEQTSLNWWGQPEDATEQLSAYLWRTHQMDAFRAAALAFGERLEAASELQPPAMRRLGVAVIGQGASPQATVPLFEKLRSHGTLFTKVDPHDGLPFLLNALTARAVAHPDPYAHWYVDGGEPVVHSERLTSVSYQGLVGVRAALLEDIQKQVSKPGMGPEQLRDHMARLEPHDLGMPTNSLVNRFAVKVLTEGSGTQIFSTTFAQWCAREALRRAEPLTLMVRFAPRQRQRPMNELLTSQTAVPELDPQGSLVDADMAAYYQWLNQQRLPGAAQACFLVWFEGQQQALAIGPGLPRGTESGSVLNLQKLVALVDS